MKCNICNQEGYSYQHKLIHDYMDEWIKQQRQEKEGYKMKCFLCFRDTVLYYKVYGVICCLDCFDKKHEENEIK